MDIIDILIAKNQSFSAETAKLTKQAQAAMNKANQVAAMADEIQSALNDAQTANEQVQQAATDINAITENINEAIEEKVAQATETMSSDIADVQNTAITGVEIFDDNTSSAKIKKTRVNKKDTQQVYNTVKNYTSTGNNEDGSMTQKAITEELNKIKVNGGGGNIDLGENNEGKIVVVGENGTAVPGTISEQDLIDALIGTTNYNALDAVGLEIDYVNRAFTRTQDAVGLSQGIPFNKFLMYGGRKRCVVDSDGRILAWYGDSNYVEDGSLGQVMIYQPKFYYNRTISSFHNGEYGQIINKEILTISATKQSGFKLHPLFKDESGNEIDYVLLPAYESCYYDVSKDTIVKDDAADIDENNDKLLSIANAKPISGTNKNFTIMVAEKMARNIGTGWHITNMAAESANQMLAIIEFGQMNGQFALESGIVNVNNSINYNGASLTGSTSALGNTTGAAASTVNELNGTYNTYSDAGRRAISYRGLENPWGNIYRFIGGVNITGNGSSGGGIAYIASDYNYTPDINGSNYKNIGFQLSSSSSWISAMGYGDPEYDWVYLPIEATKATSLVPVGDFIWTQNNLNGVNIISIGGTQRQGDNCGLFYYACDQKSSSSTSSKSARIMHIPTKDSSIYSNNITSWREKMGV